MSKILFSEMSLTPKLERAISMMGFENATPIQSEAIPVIRSGADVIARSQTGTGKTIAFAIPAIEKIDTQQSKPTIQVLILCPTRELAMQGYEEIQKLIRFREDIRPAAIYGGAPIDKQCMALRRANIVIGTPGRVMDHMRRKTIKLNHLKMIVLDEADEMLNMGFREDIETILTDTPETRQTILFSATMPPAIMKITKEFQKDPTLIEIDKGTVTIDNIDQRFVDVPHTMKQEALERLLQYYKPNCAIVFTATKKMADELTVFLNARGLSAACIHSDIKQAQRTSTMHSFKVGKTKILIATDIAARGIDVNNVEYVINYDVPSDTEYYVHRIGRTGRAGKDGCSITICGNKKEIKAIRQIAVAVKSEIKELALPSVADIQLAGAADAIAEMETRLADEVNPVFCNIVSELLKKGFTAEQVAQTAVALKYKKLAKAEQMAVIPVRHESENAAFGERRQRDTAKKSSGRQGTREYSVFLLDIGASSRVTKNHILGTIADRTGISAKELGKVNILAEQSLVEIPTEYTDTMLESMKGCKICGKPTHCAVAAETTFHAPKASYGSNKSYGKQNRNRGARSGKPARGKSKRY